LEKGGDRKGTCEKVYLCVTEEAISPRNDAATGGDRWEYFSSRVSGWIKGGRENSSEREYLSVEPVQPCVFEKKKGGIVLDRREKVRRAEPSTKEIKIFM